MYNSSFLDLKNYSLSNNLLNTLINKIGLTKAEKAISQSMDLQRMQGTLTTIPILILETCGSGLVSLDSIRSYTGITSLDNKVVLIFSSKYKSFQIVNG
tara:strand:+ start:308 stop:604 length:297 start_codon:yes stop_codon:yes gene_type:complete